jgi:hypothetical protein
MSPVVQSYAQHFYKKCLFKSYYTYIMRLLNLFNKFKGRIIYV